MPESQQQQSRGRSAVSKPLNSHPTSKRPKSGSSAAAAKGEGSSKCTQDTKSTAKSVPRSNSSAGPAPSQETGDDFKVTKLGSTTVKLSSTSWTPPTPLAKVPPPPPPPTQESSPVTDSLHLAAQVYSWSYMSSALDACFKSAEKTAIASNDLETRREELVAEEAGMSDQRQRLDAQRAIELYDELGSELFVKEAPAIMQQFQSHGDSCTNIETETLKLAACGMPNVDDEEPLKPYNQMLDNLEELQNEATSLQSAITKLTERALATPIQKEHEGSNEDASAASGSNGQEDTAREQIISVFAACLPVLKARIANLSLARDLVDSAFENARLSLQMESLGI